MRFTDTDLDTWADEFERTGATGAALFSDDDLEAWAGEHAVAEEKRLQPLRDAAAEAPRVEGPGMVPQAIGQAVGNVAALGEMVPKVDVQFGQDRPVSVSDVAPSRGGGKVYGYEIRDPFPGEDSFFKSNPGVAGMAAEDGKITLNPYSALSDTEKAAVAENEAIRLWMRDNDVVPDFSVTEGQLSRFAGTEYGKPENEKSLKQTIVARILSGDPSAQATPEQVEFAKKIKAQIASGKSRSRAAEWEKQATEISSMLGRGMAHTAEAAWQNGDFGSTQDELVESYRKVRDKVAADQEFLKTRQDWPEGLAQGLQSLPYSGVTMGASLLGHVAGVPLGKAGSVVGGGLASGATAYRASRHDFMGNVLMKATQELGRVPTPEEWGKLQQRFDEAASKYGWWEAIPEGVGNAIFLGIIGPGSKWASGKLGEKFGAGMLGTVAKGPVGRVTTGFVGTQAEEQTTEAITGWGQGGVEAEAGLRDKAPTFLEAFTESAAPTFWQTMLMQMTGHVAHNMYENWNDLGLKKDPAQMLPTDDVIDLLDVVQGPAQAPPAQPSQPAPPAAPSGGAGIGGRVNELAGQLQDLGSVPPVDEEGVGMAPVAAAPLPVDEEVDIVGLGAGAPAPAPVGVAPVTTVPAQGQPFSPEEIRGMMPPMAEPTVVPEAQSAPAPGAQNVIDLVDEVAAEIDDIEIQAQQAATSPMNDLPEPSPAQKEVGNYKKAHVRAQGFDITIENPAGSKRKGVDPDGKEWSVTINNHYGYLKGTVGADKDHLDVFLGPDPRGGDIFVVDQVDPKTGEFDEHKVVMGAGSEEEARAIYLSNYEDGWQGLGAVTRMPLGTFRKWARSSKTKKAVGDISLTPTPVADQGSNNLIDNEGDDEALQRAEAEYGSSETNQERDDEQRRPVEPGLEQHESGGVQQPADRRTGERRVRGRRGTVHYPGGSEAFTYEVIDADELIPSHDPRTAFTPREDYGYVNERDYERNEYEQGKVVEHAMELEPDLLLSDSPTAEHGGPLVDRNNRVLGGNSRAMTLQVAYDRSMEGAGRYRSSLARNAERFGLDRAEVEAMERPVLVRVMDRDVDGARAQSLVPAFNAGFTQAVDPEALGVSRGVKVSDETITVLAGDLEEGQTLRDYLAGPKAKRLVENLIEDGALDRTRLTVVMRGGEISPDGRDEIERVLRGRIVGDYGVIEGLQPSLLEALDASIPALVRLQGRGEGWDISKQFMAALRHVSRYRKNRSADGGSLDVYFRTPEMMGAIPGKKSRVVQILAHAIDNMGHAYLGKAMREFTTLAFAGQKSVAMLPGMGDLLPSRDQALEKFRTEKTPQALFEPALPAPPPAAGDPAGQAPPPVMTERDEYAALFDEELAAVQSARLPKKESIAERQRRTRAVAKKVAKRPADVHAAQERAKAGAKKMAAGARAALDVFSKYGGLSVRVVKDGDAVNQGLYDELRPHLATVMQGAKEMGLAGRDLAREVVRFLIRTFGDQAAQARPYFMKFVDEEILNKEREDVDQQRGGENLERDSEPGESQDVVGAEGVQDGRGRADRTGGQGVRGAGGQGRRSGGDPGISGRPAPSDGARGDSLVREETSGTEGRPSGSELGERSRPSGERGLAPESVADVAIERAAERSSERRIKPGKAGVGEQKKGDLENIVEQLPTLLPGQHQDVAFAEKRFENGAGVMFTNGTGTGKTGSGLGIVQRLVRAGKKNILIAVPADSIAKAWISFAEKYLGLKVSQLRNTKDAGFGVVVTTHANMGMNKALASRSWDLIIMDEAHKSMSSAGAKLTRTLQALRALALHRDGYYDLAKMRHPEAYAAAMDKENQWRESDPQDRKERALAIKKRWDDLVNEVKEEVQGAQGRVKARLDEDGGRPGVVFLSATPFAYAPNVDYAEGFLFDYPKVESRGYNQPNGQQAFMIQHFGYRMRTGKLTKPEADVDSGYMERQFNSWLKREGALSSRMLDVEQDYDRRFVLVDSAVGRTIDEGLQWLRENKRFYPLADLINERFDYHSRQYLLEAIKANEAVPLIRQHLELGRKVVVFHDFKQGGGFNPFDVSTLKGSDDEVSISTGNGKSYTVTIGELASEFAEKRPDLQELPLAAFQSPITTLSKAFSDLLLFNGDVSPKNLAAAIESFQDDASKKNLILVQSAAGEAGISLHDTTGKHQRVLINLGMPTRPVTAIQQEGRIFRIGQQSNAMFRYLNTGTSWERWAFAGTIARRASTAENLSLGEEARALRDGFIQAFEESDAWAPGHEGEGTGGKDRDRAANQTLTEWDRAKTMYFAQQRKNSRTKAAEGVDYFATPEPLGLKMVEWAGLTAGMDVLEPSAGHGAIARWFPDLVGKTSIEPSHELASRLALVTDGRIVTGTFEGLHINNKYDAIVMNPPFGHGGKTAMEHVAKAFTHLREGGRIVAIVPEGPSMERRFNAWYDSEDAKHAHLRMELSLPSAAFERAGTSVRAQVIVIDKAEKPVGDISRRSPSAVAGETVREFFDNLEHRTAPERVQTEEGRVRQALEQADAERGVFFEAAETRHTKTGEDLFVAKKTGAVSYDAFRKIKGIAKARGGWWSNFNGKGAIPGFQFRERSKRDEFLELAAEVVQKETPGVRLSRSKNPDRGLRASRVRSIVSSIAGSWVRSPRVEVVQSVRNLPENLLHAVRKAGAEGDVQGIYHEGTIYLVADRMESAVHVHRTLLHEAAGHHGLRLIMTDGELNRALDAAWGNRRVQEAVKEIAETYGLDLSDADQRREAVEEVLANWAESGASERALDRFIAAVRRAIRRVLPYLSMSDAEIRDVLVRARSAVEEGRGHQGFFSGEKRMGRTGGASARKALDAALEAIAAGADDAIMHGLRPDLVAYGGSADVKLVWGDHRKGLFHIGDRRGPRVVRGVLEAVVSGDIAKFVKAKKVVHLALDGFEAVLSLDEHGQSKTWLLTGWEINEPDAPGEVSAQFGATQDGPTFSRSDLVAGSMRTIGTSDASDKPRFARAVRQASAAIGGLNRPMTQAQIAAELEKDRTFANKVHEGRDLVRHQVQVTAADMQREVQRLAGSKRWRYNTFKVFSSEKELTDSAKSRLLDAAMLVYRDLQANPGKAQEFRDWAREQLEVKRVKGRDRIRIMEQLRVLEASENLTNEQKDFVDSVMDSAFNTVGHQAASAGIVATLLDNYVRRLWNRPQDSEKGFSGAGHAFKVFTTASKARTLETVADGWMKGYDLRVKGITSSWAAIAGEIGEIVANKSFIQEGRRQGIFSTARRAGYVPLKAKGFQVWTRKAGVKIRMAGNYGLLGADGQGRNLYVSPPKQVWAVYAKPGDRRADTLFDREKDARDYADQLRQAGNPKAVVEFRQDVDIFEKVPLYAPARVAELINRMTRSMDGDAVWKAPLPRTILQFNAAAKAWILMTSFFHHLAGSRSWMFAVNHGTMEAVRRGDLKEAVSRAASALNPVSAHKRGLEKIKGNDAVLRELIRHGLVLGELADWSEGVLAEHRGLTERLFTLMVGRVPGAEKGVAMVQAGKLFREKAANSLFKRLFAGLKAEAACVEFAHYMKLEIAAANREGRVPNTNLVAERVARLVNSDFGGLHLARMGRSPSVQAALRLLLLAPDWTESNWRTVTGVIPGLNKAVHSAMREVPGPPGMDSVFRRFWGGIILKGAASTLLLQIAVTSLFGDDDDDWRDMYREQFADWDTFRRMRWTGVDVTPIYKRLGVEVPKGERKIFSVVGHFADFLRMMDPESLIKGKLSPVMRVAGAMGTKTDYRQRPYTGFAELLDTGKTVKKSYHQPTETFFNALPSILLAQARDIQPIQVGYLLKYLQGEEDGLTALLSSGGAHMKTAWAPDLVGKEFEAAGKEINSAYRRLKELQELTRVHAAMLRSDPEAAKKLKEQRADDFNEAESFIKDKGSALRIREQYEAYQDALGDMRKRRGTVEKYQMNEERKTKDIDRIDASIDGLKKDFLEKYWRKAM